MKNNGVVLKFAFLLLLAVLLAVSCTAGPNSMAGTADEAGKTAGFFRGLWHGFIAFFSFIASLFTDSVNVYEVHNSGPLYDLGFIIGVSAFFGGSGAGSRSRRR